MRPTIISLLKHTVLLGSLACLFLGSSQAVQTRTVVLKDDYYLAGFLNQQLYFYSSRKLIVIDMTGKTRWSLPIKPNTDVIVNHAGAFISDGEVVQRLTSYGRKQFFYKFPLPRPPESLLEFGSSPVTNIGILHTTLLTDPPGPCSFLVTLHLPDGHELWRRTSCPVAGNEIEFPFPNRVDVGLTQFAVTGSGIPLNLSIYDQQTVEPQQSYSTPNNPPSDAKIKELSRAFPQGLDYLGSRHPWNCPILKEAVVARRMTYKCGSYQVDFRGGSAATTLIIHKP